MSLEYPSKNIESMIRDFLRKNTTTTTTSRTIPVKSDGVNGDIVIVQRGLNTSLYAKSGGMWHRWNKTSEFAKENTRCHVISVGMSGLSSGEKFLDLTEGIDSHSQAGNTEFIGFIFPLRGAIRRVVVKSEDIAGDTVVKIYKASAGTEVASTVVGNKTVGMASANIPYFFNYGNASFNAGEVANVSINTTGTANDTLISILVEFY